MISTGLVSVTFRKLKPSEIVKLAAEAKLDGIEWGGDIHVPHGDLKKAAEVAKITADAGIKTASYGSYYSAGCEGKNGITFGKVLETAVMLDTDTIRVWAGDRGSADADAAWRQSVTEDTVRIAGMAADVGMTISFEYHGGTLTDTSGSAIDLVNSVGAENVKCCWQPPVAVSFKKQLNGLKQIQDILGNIHVFWWDEDGRQPLSKGLDRWDAFMDIIKKAGGNRFCMLEFVKDDDPEQFLLDAKILHRMISDR